MYGKLVVYFTTLICLLLSISVDTLDWGHNIFCKVLPQVVPVNGGGLPYFVELQRCQGSIKHSYPELKNCTFATYNEVKVTVTTHDGNELVVTLKNHTSCKEQCAKACSSSLLKRDEETCACTCPHNKPPEGHGCPNNFTWDHENCKCHCYLKEGGNSRKKVDKEQCKFVCKPHDCGSVLTLHPDKCTCYRERSGGPASVANNEGSDSTHQGKVLAALVIGEFVFLYLIFDFLLYSKKTGLMYYVRCKCRGKPNDEPAQTQSETRRCLETEENGNNVPLNVVVDRNGCSQVAPGSCQHVSST